MLYVAEQNIDGSVDFYRVIEITNYNTGSSIVYRKRGKKYLMYVGKDFTIERLDCKDCIMKVAGNSSNAVLKPVDKDMPGEDLSMLYRTDAMARGYKTMYEKKVDVIKLAITLGIVVIVIVVVVLGFNFIKGMNQGGGGSVDSEYPKVREVE